MASSLAAAAACVPLHRRVSLGASSSARSRAPVRSSNVTRCDEGTAEATSSPKVEEYSRAFSLDLKRPMGMVLNSGREGVGRVRTSHFMLQPKNQLMTASMLLRMLRVTNLTTDSENQNSS
jgi:hypothetical protein